MKKVTIAILAFIGFFSLLAVAVVAAFGVFSVISTERLPSSVILEIDFEQSVIESVPDDPIAQMMMEDVLQLRDIVDALDRAAGDRRVKALVARIGAGGMGLAHIQEIRDAVMRFRGSGKPAYAFAETFGEFGPGNGGYYLATAFDRIYLQPSGDIGLTGMIYESPFIRGLFDKLEITPQMDQRWEYKNAMNLYTERSFTEPHREAMQALMESQFGQMVRGISDARGIPEQEIVELFDTGPFLGEEAQAAGLVDELGYRDQAYGDIRQEAGDRAELVYLAPYLRGAGRPNKRGETIALIQGYGAVVRGKGGYSPIDGSVSMGSDSTSRAFRAAVRDPRVRAIVFRVDSPGGSYVASDTIWRESARARESGKPVIVSMGNLAGSGGYFVAMNADKIVAQPGTITASIGVLGGKLLTRKFWEKLGITWDEVYTSEHSRMWTGTYEYGPAYARFQASLDRIYEDFTVKVADGRNLPLERVREIAKGRIWTGEEAQELGLVDELGGLDVAFRLAREAVDLEPDAPIRIKRFPPRRSPLDLLFQKSSNSERVPTAALVRSLRAVQPHVRMLRKLGILGNSGLLEMPEVPATD